MLEIPGEEAPTDPGIQAKARQEQEEKARREAQAKKNRVVAAVAFVAVLGLGAGGWTVWQSQQAAMTYELDDYYALELEDIQAAPAEAPTPQVDATATASNTPRNAGTRRPAGGSNTVDVADRSPGDPPPLKSASGGSTGGDVMQAAVSTALPTGGAGLGGGAIRVEHVGADVVLTDDAAIYDMAKRVINASSPQLQSCYNQRLKQVEGLKGAWDVSFVIAKEGVAKNVRVAGVNGADAELESCMARAVGSWRFQKIAKDQPVKKTYRFGAGGW